MRCRSLPECAAKTYRMSPSSIPCISSGKTITAHSVNAAAEVLVSQQQELLAAVQLRIAATTLTVISGIKLKWVCSAQAPAKKASPKKTAAPKKAKTPKAAAAAPPATAVAEVAPAAPPAPAQAEPAKKAAGVKKVRISLYFV